MRPYTLHVLAAVVVALLGSGLSAQATWTGAVSSDWSLAANWSGGPPSSGTDVVIPPSTPNPASTAAVTVAFCRDLTVAAGATLAIPPGSPLQVSRDATVDGSLAGAGLLRFVSAQTSWFGGGGAIGVSVECAKGAGFDLRPVQSMTINGSFTTTSGNLVIGISNGPQISVTGNLVMQGGALSTFQPATALLDVAGNVTFSGTLVPGFIPAIRCGGNWTSDAAFTPTVGLVELDGSGAQSIAAVTAFQSLTIHQGSVATAPAAGLTVNGNLTVDGSLAASSGPVDVGGDLAVGTSGALDLGGGADTFAKDFTIDGALIATGTLVFDGTATGLISSVSPLPNVVCAKSTGQVRPVANVTISGNLTQTSGDLNVSISPGIQVSVSGNAILQGGTLTATQPGILDVAGNVTFGGTSATASIPTIRCAGHWSSDAAFAPASGTVELDGVSPTTVALATAGGTLAVPNLVVKNGLRTFANDLTIAAGSLTVGTGGSLAIGGGRHVRVHRPAGPTAFTVSGPLSVAANGELSLGAQTTLTVDAAGGLSLVGAAAQPAKLTGEQGGGYAVVVNGVLAAKDFVVKEPGPAGMVVDFGATIAAAPNDFRNGTFDFRAGAQAGSALLDVRRHAPAAPFDGLVFQNTPAAAGVFNVRSHAAGVPVGFTNWSGAVAGPSFEDDPNGLVAWNLQAPPALSSFAAIPGADLAEIVWHMINETGAASYHVRRATSAAGPFPVLFTVGAGGVDYGMVDQPLAAGQMKFYLLYANLTGGDSRLLASASVTPYSSLPPPNVYKVGVGAAFSTIQAAIGAATAPNSVVWVTPGVYASFSIGASAPSNLHVVGDGTGTVAIDTSAGPVSIANVPAASSVELSNLTIGASQTAQNAVVISGCAGAVVLDQVDALCDAAHTGVQVVSSPSVAIQRSTIGGAPGLLIQSGSHVAISRGSLTSLSSTGSTIEMAGLTPGSVNVTPAGALVTRAGTMPDVDLPELAKLSYPQVLFVDAFPNSPFILIASPRLAFTTVAPFEMPVLVDIAGLIQLPLMQSDGAGHAAVGFEISPDASLLGFTYVVQLGALDPSSNNWRFSNVETVVAVP